MKLTPIVQLALMFRVAGQLFETTEKAVGVAGLGNTMAGENPLVEYGQLPLLVMVANCVAEGTLGGLLKLTNEDRVAEFWQVPMPSPESRIVSGELLELLSRTIVPV